MENNTTEQILKGRKENILNIEKTKYKYFMSNSNKYLDKTAIRYVIPVEKGETAKDSVDLNRDYKDIKISKKELIKNIDKTADALWSMGIRKGDIVIMCSSNTPETIYMDYALNKIGAIPDYVYPNITSEEMKYFVSEVNPKFIFMLDQPEIRKMVVDATKDTCIEHIISASVIQSFPGVFKKIADLKNKKSDKVEDDRIIEWDTFIKNGKDSNSEECVYDENATSCLVHTSGTTNVPKAVMQLNKNTNAIVRNYELSGQRFEAGKKYLQVLPIFVSFGNSTFQAMFCNNVEIVMIPEMNPKNFPGLLEKYEPNYLTVTPSHWGALLKSERMSNKNLSYLELAGSGGDGFATIEDRVNSFLKQHSCNTPVTDGYGSTEVSAIALSNLVGSYKKGSLGRPMGNVKVGVFDPETGAKLDTNDVGEFAISGDTVTAGYYKDEEKTKEVYKKHDDGNTWVHMGDLGRIDEDGFGHYEGRIKNVIARRSFKFSPVSEEKEIEKHPNVDTCCIIALPDEEEGQVPIAHITLNDYSKASETLDEIISASSNIQELHRPVVYKIRKELPKTKNNKNNLNALRIEDLAMLYPGVLHTNINSIYDGEHDYCLEIEVNPELALLKSQNVNVIEDIQSFVDKKMIEQKIARANIIYNIQVVDKKYSDSKDLYKSLVKCKKM